MKIRVSHFVAEIEGKSIYATSHHVHDGKAILCRMFDRWGLHVGDYIVHEGRELHAPHGFEVTGYPAIKIMTDKLSIHLQRQAGIDD